MTDNCKMCDANGMAEILPDTNQFHATLCRCPHNAAELVAIKQRTEDDQAALMASRRPRPRIKPEDDEVIF